MRTGTRRLVPTLVGVMLLTTFLPLVTPRPVAAAAPTDLFFSEYIEGSSNNKALEIYNGTGAPVVLDAGSYKIQMFFNGATTAGRTENLSGTVADGDVFVIAQATANASILAQADELSTAAWYNGDDAVVLSRGTQVLDVIGQIGVDPGTEWGTGLTSTADNTLRRNASICAGDTNGTDAFDPATEWTGLATDDSTNLGSHTANCGGGGTPNLSVTDVSHNEGNSGTSTYSFAVNLSTAAGAGGVTFDIATSDDSATVANNDYVAKSLTGQTIPTGSSTYAFDVTVNGDLNFEPNEQFFVSVTNVSGANVTDGQGVGTITNDDVDCSQPFTPIWQVQGSGPNAAITGNVTTQGVVVGDFEGSAANSGFFMQDPTGDGNDATSDGIFVFTGNSNLVSVGENVRVTGFARERFNQTTLNGSNSNASPVTIVGECAGSASVTPTNVLLPFADADYPERYEGMLVRLPQSLVVAEYFNYDRFGEIVLAKPLAGETRPFTGTAIETPGAAANARTLANSLSRITLDDVQAAQNPASLRHPDGGVFALNHYFRGGDKVENTVGVLGFDFNLYRIYPTAGADYTAVNPRPSAPENTNGRLTVASQNTLNFFVTLDDGSPHCGPTGTLDCRGANTSAEFTRQRDKLLAALTGLNADVIGLNELENTTGAEPLDSIVAGLPGYEYIHTGTIGTDAIKVGLIYRPDIVTPVGPYALLTSAVDPRFIDTKSRPVLAQTFMENATGEVFTVAVNHLKSKGSDCNDIGDLDAGDGQGNCNQTRTSAARALVDWLATDPTGSGDPDFLVVGDLNSYAMEDPITAIKAGPDDAAGTSDDYTNLIKQYIGTYAYSYVFDGQAGYLDYALSSATLTDHVTGAAEWHINADEADVLDYDVTFKSPGEQALYEPAAYRISDHDSVLVGLDLLGPPATISVTAGDNQSTTVDTDFGTQLSLTVLDSANQPVPNATVTFTGPASGASASIVEAGPYTTDANGNLTVTAHANTVAGSYQLAVAAGGASANFSLTNNPGNPASVRVNAGDNQSTVVNTDFPTQLDLTVLDQFGNPVPATTVTFAGPASGASASVVEAAPHTTDSSGNLVVTAHANTTAGAYGLVATAGTATATFHLTNLWAGTGQLIGGGSTCAAFAGSSLPTLSQVTYSVNKGKINGLSEGTFSYWVRVVAPAGNNALTIDESVTSGNLSTLLGLGSGSNVYASDCSGGLKASITQSSVNAASGTISVTFTAPAAGTYYLGIKLTTNTVKGLAQPSPTTVTYQFSTRLVADTTRGLDLVKQ